MEKVSSHLSALQEEQMDLCDKDSRNLIDHIKYWGLLRREQVILCAARKRGMSKVGLQAVPPAKVCEEMARQAIAMQMVLTSLQGSVYGNEPWSLCETSSEMYNSEPQETFKKGGVSVRVTFDGDANNEMLYTMWGSVYRCVEGIWRKEEGGVDHNGIYTRYEGHKSYYIDFGEEAQKYSSLGAWAVRLRGELLTDSELVTSSTDSKTTQSACTKKPLPGPVGPHPEDPATTARTPDVSPITKAWQPWTSTPTKGGQGPHKKEALGLGRLGEQGEHPPVAAAGPVHCGLSTDRSFGSTCDSDTDCNLPVIIYKGTANQLKCFRFRIRQHCKGIYCNLTTTWQWLGNDGVSRTNNHRIIVAFENCCKRGLFMKTVVLPEGVTYKTAYMPL
ncbi:E2 protein [Phocoena phocoena papillomavirus 4]|uniref:Regulatory protein E2 n=1 Tax=Phocoena phocoena papillomavirus 4 TaxID=706527 RepID=F2VIS2_9PAPI|nr:E2 protein [Phocoena phocoena papillomavirus 4]ADJ96355.1 E2 protein [Phocoena phocoena papillomavirus 4]